MQALSSSDTHSTTHMNMNAFIYLINICQIIYTVDCSIHSTKNDQTDVSTTSNSQQDRDQGNPQMSNRELVGCNCNCNKATADQGARSCFAAYINTLTVAVHLHTELQLSRCQLNITTTAITGPGAILKSAGCAGASAFSACHRRPRPTTVILLQHSIIKCLTAQQLRQYHLVTLCCLRVRMEQRLHSTHSTREQRVD